MAKVADKYFITHPWKVVEQGFDPDYARVSESVFALCNESLGVRGFFDEGGSVPGLRGAYTNGVYERECLPKSYRGIVDKSHFMIPSADWLVTGIAIDGETLDMGSVSFTDYVRELDMLTGTLTRSFIWHTKTNKALRVRFLRFLDMLNGERAYQRITLEALNFSGAVELESGVSFNVLHQGRNACFWGETRMDITGNRCSVQSGTLMSGQEVFAGAVWDAPGVCHGKMQDKTALLSATVALRAEKPVNLDKRAVVLFDGTSGQELWENGCAALSVAACVPFDEALEAQRAYWAEHWRISDIEIAPGDASGQTARSVAEDQQGIRFCSFQLAQIYSGGSVRHNIGAKGLTGEVYNGHAFWDTEACCLPFYLFTEPKAARSLLLFRYNTLDKARERARMLDCDGACFPVATLNGEEACSLWQHANLQLQPSTAVAYGVWHYVRVTGDDDFLWQYGAEMLLEIARFLCGRAGKSASTGKYGYFGVMGPDEFHLMVDNNAYTNYMGKRTLEYALETLKRMEELHADKYAALCEKTCLRGEELCAWRTVADNMELPITGDGIIEQHTGYFDLPHIDINAIPVCEFPLYDHWSYDRIYRTDMVKQPDVLMLFYLYNGSFTRDVKRANYDFYEPRTIHESSLSPSVHSILAAELGRMDEATGFFGYATRLDLDNYNRNTGDGLHTTSLAMAWANIVYGFAGLRSDGELLRFAPRLPKRWGRLAFSLFYKGRILSLNIDKSRVCFKLRQGEPISLLVYDKSYELGASALNVAVE